MGMTENQLQLVKAIAQNDMTKAKAAAIACCTEDTTRKNEIEVEKCKNLLMSTPNIFELPSGLTGLLVVEDVTGYNEKRYYLTHRESELLERIQKMNKASMQLKERGIHFLNATLLYGESGVGKTEFARYIAHKMQLPFAYLNFSNTIDSYLGKTANNLREVFSFVKNNPCVLMIDEIDAIGTKRGMESSSAGKEMERTTISLMQCLDQVSNELIILSATNLFESIDPALKRRFPMKHKIQPLKEEEMKEMIKNYCTDAGFLYADENIEGYLNGKGRGKNQSHVISYMIQCMADALIADNDSIEM